MDKNKKKIIIIICFILIGICLLALVLSNKKIKKESEPSPSVKEEGVINKEIIKLNDEKIFFGLQQIINDFYLILKDNNNSKILSLIDKDYILENDIDASNISEYFNVNFDIPSYVILNVYYNPNSSTTFYFINGYFISSSLLDEDDLYMKDVNYIVVVDEKTNNYTIRPIKEGTDILSYANNYNLEVKQINNGYKFSRSSISETNKLVMYINNFRRLVSVSPSVAYDILDETTKKRYQDYQSLANSREELYEKYSSKIFSYSSKMVNNTKVYSIIDDKQNRITIYEDGIMNYKIQY